MHRRPYVAIWGRGRNVEAKCAYTCGVEGQGQGNSVPCWPFCWKIVRKFCDQSELMFIERLRRGVLSKFLKSVSYTTADIYEAARNSR